MRVELEWAFILHRRPYRDTSLLLDAYTREHGRIGLIARGARRPKARLRGLLEPLRCLRLSWSGRGELLTLTGAEADTGLATPAGDALYAGFYASELMLRLTARADPQPELFDRFRQLHLDLCEGAPIAATLRVFERDLLAELGYGLPLTVETETGEALQADRSYLYDAESGIRHGSRPQAGEIAISGAALLALAEGCLQDPEHARAARRFLAAALKPHLGGRALRSAETLRALRQLRSHNQEPSK